MSQPVTLDTIALARLLTNDDPQQARKQRTSAAGDDHRCDGLGPARTQRIAREIFLSTRLGNWANDAMYIDELLRFIPAK
jgi:hypothetical protein